MVVAAQHNWSNFAVSYHFIEFQGNISSSEGVLIENAALGSYYQLIFLCVPDPDPVILILRPAVRIDDFHSCVVGLYQVLMFSGQAAPPEGTVAVVKELRPHNIFHIGRENEALTGVSSVFRNILCPGVKDSLHKGVSVVEEIGSPFYQFFNQVEMPDQRHIDKLCEMLLIMSQHLGSLLEGEALRAVAAVVRHMAAGLIGEQFNLDLVIHRVL